MAHAHHHHHEGEQNAYFLEQIFTIAVCGALGGVALMLWYTNRLSLMLVDRFFPWVFAGGCALLVLVLIRAIAVWRSVDEITAGHSHAHDHDHDHDHAHGHEHHHHEHAPGEACNHGETCSHDHTHELGHDHEHPPLHSHGYDTGHDHGWAPWRYVVLLIPVLLYFLNLPNEGFSSVNGSRLDLDVNAPLDTVASTGRAEIGFSQLEQMALTEEGRDAYEGKTITLTGQYSGGDERKFTLVRYKRVCCSADARPLNAVIMVDPKSSERLDPVDYRNQWVEVTGRVHFIQRDNTFITAILLYPSKEEQLSSLVKVVRPDPNPFVN